MFSHVLLELLLSLELFPHLLALLLELMSKQQLRLDLLEGSGGSPLHECES